MNETELDARRLELNRNVRSSGDPFRAVLARAKARHEYEQIIQGYLDLLGTGAGSSYVNLKVLQAMEEIRAPDISRQSFRTSRIGEMRRRRWPSHRVKPDYYGLDGVSLHRHRNRALRSTPESQVPIIGWFREGENEEILWQLADDAPILDFSRTLLLHMGFVGDNLIMALDENLALHCYGEAALASQTVWPNAFADYGYLPETLNPSGVVWGPVVRQNVRSRLVAQAERLHSRFERDPDARVDQQFGQDIANEIDSIIGIQELQNKLKTWAADKGCNLEEICLVFLPDEMLFLLPLGFLGLSHGAPLAHILGGVSIAFSLVALKKSLADYHWGSVPNRRGDAPTCVLFATNNKDAVWLDLRPEIDCLKQAFGEQRFLPVASSKRNEFHHWYSAGDICWFAGHGSFDVRRYVEVDNEILPLPESGPLLEDGPLTNLDLITTALWNFKPLWLSVFNCCVLGRHFMVGPNPLGFMSALVTVGASSAIGALWPVGNQAAITLAQYLAIELNQTFNDRSFPRAKALSCAVRRVLEEGRVQEWEVAPYALWGLP